MTANQLTFIRDSETQGYAYYRCSCGKVIKRRTRAVNSDHTKSCGHLRVEFIKNHGIKHGHALLMGRSKTYKVWLAMRRRCNDPKQRNYKHYGGRGITVCERWQNDFMNFYNDMGAAPIGKTIDRIKVNGNYEPGNCRWATKSEQERNKRG